MFKRSQTARKSNGSDSRNLDLHVFDSLYDCKGCKCVFYKIEEFALHSCSAEEFNECFGCGKRFPTLGLLALHKCSNKVSYQCDKCQEIFYDACEFVLHKCSFVMPLTCYVCETIFPEISALALHKCSSQTSDTYSSFSLPTNSLIRSTNISSSVCNQSFPDNREPLPGVWNPLVESTETITSNSVCQTSINISEKSVLDNCKCLVHESLSVPLNPLLSSIETSADVCDESLSVPLNPLISSMETSADGCDESSLGDWKPLVHESLSVPLDPLVSSMETIADVCDESSLDNWKPLVHESQSVPLNPITRNFLTSDNVCDKSFFDNCKYSVQESVHVPLEPLISLRTGSKDCNINWQPILPKLLSMPFTHIIGNMETRSNVCGNGKPWTLFPELSKKMFFGCDQCDKFCFNKGALTVHKKIHEVTDHECDICHRSFSCRQKLLSHRKLHKISQLSVIIKSTNASSDSNIGDNQQPSNHRFFKYYYKCLQCDKIYHTQDALNQHKLTHKNTFSSYQNLHYYIKLHKIPKLFLPFKSLKENANISSKEMPCTCNLCHKTYSKLRHSAVAVHKCDICHKMFLCNKDFHRHKRLHETPQLLNPLNYRKDGTKTNINASDKQSKLCDKIYSKQGTVPKQVPKVQYECDICHQIFLYDQDLRHHRQLHKTFQLRESSNFLMENSITRAGDNQKPLIHKPLCVYKCSECNKTFTKQGALALHKRSHKMQYECDICHKTFSCSERLICHKQLHGSLFRCDMCIETFSTLKALGAHMFIHGC